MGENDCISLPEAFARRMKTLLGNEWEAFLDCFGKGSYHGLRLNPLKKGLDSERKKEIFEQFHIKETNAVSWASDAYYYDKPDDGSVLQQPGKHPYHEAGVYYIQEPSAMSAAALLQPQPGERVLDLCAAPGGKSTQLASYMRQQGLLVVNEIHPARAKILAQNVERMGIANALVCNEDSAKLAACFPGFFQRILVDAPCSGEGMFRKNPEAAQEWSENNVRLCAERQEKILDHAADMLQEGGRLVYSTCTFAPEENEQTIAAFLKRHPEFQIVKVDAPYFAPGHPEWSKTEEECLSDTFRLWPHKLHGEGHYAAVLVKGQERFQEEERAIQSNPNKKKSGVSSILDKSQQESLREFADQTLTPDMKQFLLEGRLVLFGDYLYRLPEDTPNLTGLHVLRAGLCMGTFKKNRFEPSHALALFLGSEDVTNAVELTVPEVAVEEPACWKNAQAYLRGETVVSNGKSKKGWCLMCIRGMSVGWGKQSGEIIKNHYPKGLRIQG